jgi:HK97 family phage prohead protease
MDVPMTRDTHNVVKAGTQSADDPFKFVLSDETVDRMGDIIRAKGWKLANFKKNAIALFGHQHSFPIGTWKDVKVEGTRLIGTLHLAKDGTSERIDEIRALLEQRILKAVSVGFSIKDYVPMDEKEPWGGWDIKSAELHETSVVSVPANPSAVLLAKSIGVSAETRSLIFGTGQTPTFNNRKSHGSEADATPSDYSDLVGESSDVLRRRKALRLRGLIE